MSEEEFEKQWKEQSEQDIQKFIDYVNNLKAGSVTRIKPIVLDDSIRPEDVVMVRHPTCKEQII